VCVCVCLTEIEEKSKKSILTECVYGELSVCVCERERAILKT